MSDSPRMSDHDEPGILDKLRCPTCRRFPSEPTDCPDPCHAAARPSSADPSGEPPIVLFDIDGVILGVKGDTMPGATALIDTLMCLGFEVHFWSAGGVRHVGDALQRAGIYGGFRVHEKPTYPPTEAAALKIVGRRPALQIDDDPTERVADWPFMVWPYLAAADPSPTTSREGLREAAFKSEMARRSAVGALRNVRKAMGALIQVMLHAGYTPADNEHLRFAIGANIVSLATAEQSDDEFRAALAASPSPQPDPVGLIEAVIPPSSMRGERYRGWTEAKAAILTALSSQEPTPAEPEAGK